jgi:PAP2 superfamily
VTAFDTLRLVLFTIAVVGCDAAMLPPPAHAADAVTRWSEFAIRPGEDDGYDWHSVVLMHAAIHDTLNAIRPRFATWADRSPAAGPVEPAGDADPEAAVAAAAHAILSAGAGPDDRAKVDALLAAALDAVPDRPGKRAGVELGRAIAAATRARRAADWRVPVDEFSTGSEPGVWRPTPPFFRIAGVGRYRPFAFSPDEPVPMPPPPALGSSEYRDVVAEVREMGALESARRTPAQTSAAAFWAEQNSQRNFHVLAIRLLAAKPGEPDLWLSARVMALMSFAMADSVILAWPAKERFRFWRPITAIRAGGFGVAAEPGWQPLVQTPPHPEHPSGHATDCAAGARSLELLFPPASQPVRYIAIDVDGTPAREFAKFAAIAEECASSRLWAGVHFSTANQAGSILGRAVADRVVGTMLRPAQ